MYVESPTMPTFLANLHRKPSNLFIYEEVILSQEGNTQAGPAGMPMYGIAVLPSIKGLRDHVKHFWYADDSAAGGKLEQLKSWWEAVKEPGTEYG